MNPDLFRRALRPGRGRGAQSWKHMLVVGAILVGVYAWEEFQRSRTPVSEGLAAIREAYENERSGVFVEASGRIRKALGPDNDGKPHQRFILDIDRRHSVLIAHNLDLAPEVPAEEGDEIRFRGRYEWNAEGGTVHWTHHDPRGRTEGGWIEFDGQRYE